MLICSDLSDIERLPHLHLVKQSTSPAVLKNRTGTISLQFSQNHIEQVWNVCTNAVIKIRKWLAGVEVL